MNLKFFHRQDHVDFDQIFHRIEFIPWGLCGLLLFRCFLLVLYGSEASATLTPGINPNDLSAIPVQSSQGFEALTQKIEQKIEQEIQQEIQQEIKIVEISLLPNQERDNITVNPEQTYQAFTICQALSDGKGCQEQIFIEDMTTGKFYQIQGIPLSWRPFTNLAWTDEKYLAFDRWSNPYYGLHYVVDMNQKKLVDISAVGE